jgi:hypothetical protein
VAKRRKLHLFTGFEWNFVVLLDFFWINAVEPNRRVQSSYQVVACWMNSKTEHFVKKFFTSFKLNEVATLAIRPDSNGFV